MDIKRLAQLLAIPFSLGFLGSLFCIGIPEDIERKKQRLISIVEQREEKKKCFFEIQPEYSREDLEKIIGEENKPIDAFNRISADITFRHHRDGDNVRENYPGKECERWYSLQELYSLGEGVCIDGTIGFCSLLIDNPEYPCYIGLFRYKENGKNKTHAVSFFEENDKLGYASFNDPGAGEDSVFQGAEYDDVRELIIKRFNGYDSYALIEIDSERMKFGKAIKGNKELGKIDWQDIKALMNERRAKFRL